MSDPHTMFLRTGNGIVDVVSIDKETNTIVLSEPISSSAINYKRYTFIFRTVANGIASHAEGGGTYAHGDYSHAEGEASIAMGTQSHAEGASTIASIQGAHAEGSLTRASGRYSHAEGHGTISSGVQSHAEGNDSIASGRNSHAGGSLTIAGGQNSYAHGIGLIVRGGEAHVFGKYNIPDNDERPEWVSGTSYNVGDKVKITGEDEVVTYYDCRVANSDTTFTGINWTEHYEFDYVEIVGNGTGFRTNDRSNARTLDWQGNEWLAGKVSVGTAASPTPVTNANDLTTKKYVDDAVAGIPDMSAHFPGSSFVLDTETSVIGDVQFATAEGKGTTATGNYAHAEGRGCTASNDCTHAEGNGTTANAANAHAEGGGTTASSPQAHAEGASTTASGGNSHAEGGGTTASGDQSHAEGGMTVASGVNSHAEGFSTTAASKSQHVQGEYNTLDSANPGQRSTYADIVGNGTDADNRSNAFALTWTGDGRYAGDVYVKCDSDSTGGTKLITTSDIPVTDVQVDGTSVVSNGVANVELPPDMSAHFPGTNFRVDTGNNDFFTAQYASAEGQGTTASGNYSHAEGSGTTATEIGSHAEGVNTKATGYSSHAEGEGTTASGAQSHAEGNRTTANGFYSHAEGSGTTANGEQSHAEGSGTRAYATNSHAEGTNTLAYGKAQHVFGEYNVQDGGNNTTSSRATYVEIVGNGTFKTRSNARTLDWSGNEALAGSITLGKGTADEVTLTAANVKALLALLN